MKKAFNNASVVLKKLGLHHPREGGWGKGVEEALGVLGYHSNGEITLWDPKKVPSDPKNPKTQNVTPRVQKSEASRGEFLPLKQEFSLSFACNLHLSETSINAELMKLQLLAI